MADVITRFKLETTQYDSKLRDAAKGLKEVVRQAELGGKGFQGFSQKAIESARALGQIESGANNTKDRLKDLVGSFNDVAKAYNNLNKEQQQSDFGQAMSKSLEQLQSRIKETKDELYNLDSAAKSLGSSESGGLLDMMSVAGGNLMAQGITKLTSELIEGVKQSVELARAGEGIRMAFDRLNKPGLLDKLKEATHGTVSEIELMQQAIKFENFKLPLEDLATYLSFAQQKAKDTGESIDYLVNSIVNGLGRQSKQILDNLGISAAELTKRMNEGADMTKAVADIIREEMEKAGDYVETAADRAAQASADAKNKMEELGRAAQPFAEAWASVWNEIKIGGMDFLTNVLGPIAESAASIRKILNGEFNLKEGVENLAYGPSKQKQTKKPTWGDVPAYTAPGGYVEVTDANTGAVIGGKHFDDLNDKNSINDWRKSLHKTPKTKTSTGKTLEEKIAWDPNKANLAATKAVDTMPSVWAMMGDDQGLRQMMGIDRQQLDLGRVLDEYVSDPDKDKRNKKAKDPIAELSKAINGLTSIRGGLEGMGIKLPEEIEKGMNVIQGLISIIQGVQTIISIFSTSTETANTIAVTANTVALGALTSAVVANTATNFLPFANGGIVRAANGYVDGNTYSGDQIPALLNAGELVLNRSQQGVLASALNGGLGAMQLSAIITGEQIRLVLNNNGRRTGRGEYVTTNFK